MREINQVRQILMNEMGLTRESIRDLTVEIVTTEVAKHVNYLLSSGQIEMMVSKTINDLARENRWDTNSLRSIVLNAAKLQIGEFIKENLVIKGV
jgi:hypothetical protein